jgi:tryptophan synthase alpha subunit
MEFLTILGGCCLGVVIGSAVVKTLETNGRIKKLQEELEKGEKALKEVLPNLPKPDEEGTKK